MIVLKDNSKNEIEIAIKKLEDKIPSNTGIISNLAQEVEARQNADNSLNNLINNEVNRATSIESSITNSIDNIQADINTINSYIPDQTSIDNQLADKDFVNSSISTATATFIGTFNSIEEITGDYDNNDYVFIQEIDSAGNTLYKRYKYNGSEWIYEYTINNSGFTAEQWAAINSGITAELVALFKKTSIEAAWPVGSIYISSNNTNPAELFGFGTWEQITDKFIYAAGSKTVNTTGGEEEHILLLNELPQHTHTFTGTAVTSGTPSNNNTSSSGSHNHSIWRGYGVTKDAYWGAVGRANANIDSNTLGSNGAHTHTLSNHTHTVVAAGTNSNTGGDVAHNNMPPYVVKYMWERVN